jgi:colanic acid biosynthesis glycosyl transferase WcaI
VKILLYSINYAPEVTSTGKYTGEMGQWLAERGHEVRVVTAPPYYPAWQVGEGYSTREYRREHIRGMDISRCPLWVPSQPTGTKRLLHLMSFVASSLPVMLRRAFWSPDVVVSVVPPLFAAPSAWLVARLCGVGLWLHIQDFELDAATGLGMLGKGRLSRVLQEIEEILLRSATRVSTITETMRRRAVQKGAMERNTRLFPNWSDVTFIRPMSRDNEVRHEFGASLDDVLVMYAGNMGEKQGLELVLEAADRLRKRPRIRFVLVGDGAARRKLERTVKERTLDNVSFFPVQPLERLPRMLAAGDVHLVVQRREAADLVMPSKLTNILAAGRPAVATAEPGTALYDVIMDNDCGVTTAPGDVEELVAGIVALSENPPLREQLGRNARHYAEAYLDHDKILSRFESELRQLTRSKV